MTPFYTVDTVIFDCDSTLSAIEGIDELARRAGVHDQLAPLTDKAMTGELPLDEVYARRLDLIRPGKTDIDWLGAEYIRQSVKDAKDVIHTLQQCDKSVHIVSGGIYQAVVTFSESLGVDASHVHAVSIRFDKEGRYTGYDQASPLVRNHGKKTICREIIGEHHHAVMIGDGLTDLEAAQERVAFIGYGGIVHRDVVKEHASDFFDTPTLAPVLERVLDRSTLMRISE